MCWQYDPKYVRNIDYIVLQMGSRICVVYVVMFVLARLSEMER